MEQNNEMTAQESLALIARTMDSNRKDIIRKGGKYFILWGCLLTIFSLLIYFLWKTTESGAWNNLWFVMPIVGYGLSLLGIIAAAVALVIFFPAFSFILLRTICSVFSFRPFGSSSD